jgi:hypothetical protein
VRRRVLATLAALVVAIGGIWIASAAAQTEPQPTAPLGTYCPPLPANAVAGQDHVCKVVADPFWTPPTTTPPTTTTTSSTTTVPTTTTTPVTTTTTQPPAALMGWQLTATNIGLAPLGLSCDALPLYAGPARPAAGATISGVRIESALNMTAGNVTVEKSCIKPRNQGVLGSLSTTTVCPNDCNIGMPSGAKATIRDSEISGAFLSASAVATACAFDGVADIARTYIHDVGSGICFRETGLELSPVVENNYVHKLRHSGEAHHDAATVRDFRKNPANTRKLTWRGNRFDSTTNTGSYQTGALFIQPTWSGYGIHNVWVVDNYLEGGGFNLTLEQSNGGNSNTHSLNNRFRHTEWGYSTVSGSPGWSEWSSNFRYDPNAVNAQGEVVNP